MLKIFERLPTSIKIFLFLVFVVIGLGIYGKKFIENPSLLLTTQNEQKSENAEEITVRIQIRDKKTKTPILDVTVEFERLGEPVPLGRTDNAGYIDTKIPKTDFIKVYLSKPGFESANYQINSNIKDRNIIYYLKEVSSSSQPSQKVVLSPQSPQNQVSQVLSGQNNLNSKTEVGSDNNYSQQAEGFQFDLQNCNQPNDVTLICRMKITSREKDSPLRMHGNYNQTNRTRIIESGNEYIAKNTQMGSSSSAGSSYVESDFIKSIPLNASVVFGDISSQVDKIQVLEVSFYNKISDTSFKVRFRNVAVSK